MSAIHVCMALGLHSLYAVSLGHLAETTARPSVRRLLLLITGLVLVGLAARIVFSAG